MSYPVTPQKILVVTVVPSPKNEHSVCVPGHRLLNNAYLFAYEGTCILVVSGENSMKEACQNGSVNPAKCERLALYASCKGRRRGFGPQKRGRLRLSCSVTPPDFWQVSKYCQKSSFQSRRKKRWGECKHFRRLTALYRTEKGSAMTIASLPRNVVSFS